MARDPRYSTVRWRRLRDQVIRRDGRVCAVSGCTADMTVRYMTHVDHIVEVKDGGNFWDPNNCRVLCKFHHASKSLEVMGERRSGGTRPRAARGDLTPGDPRFCWRKGDDGLWHHYLPAHNMGECEWPGCPHNEEYELWKSGR